jgi:hypothetical protein
MASLASDGLARSQSLPRAQSSLPDMLTGKQRKRQATYHSMAPTGFTGARNEKGEAHGHGIHMAAGGSRYVGEFVSNRAHGHGTQCFASGSKYDGAWHEGKMHGAGIYTWPDGETDFLTFDSGRPVGDGVRLSNDRLLAYRLVDGNKAEPIDMSAATARVQELGLSVRPHPPARARARARAYDAQRESARAPCAQINESLTTRGATEWEALSGRGEKPRTLWQAFVALRFR